MLRIRTLGGLSVQGAGRSPAGAASQPRRLAVLALIARAGERGITRDKLLAMLWPDSDVETGRRSLSQALYALRRDLNADELLLGVQELRLNPDVVTSDVTEFEVALAERNVERAADLYGGAFLDGFRLPGSPDFDRWAEEERRVLAQRHVEALERLARRVADRGDAAAAATWWRRLAELDPLNARVAMELMRSLVAAGDPGGALTHARIYEVLLAQELDLEPDRQVIELAKRIRAEATAPSSPAAVRVTPNADTAVAERPVATIAPGDAPEAERVAHTTAPGAPAPEPVAVAPERAAVTPPTARARDDTTRASTEPATIARPRRRIAVIAAGVAGLTALAAAAWWGGTRAASSRRMPVLAVGRVVDFRTTDRRDAEAVGDMLATNLARVNGLQVLSSARLYEVMAQIDDPKLSPNANVARAAQRAGASEVLEGALHALSDGRLMLDLRRVELKTGALRAGYRSEGSDVYALVTQATKDLAANLDHPAGQLDPGEVSTRSLVAYRFYEEGLRNYSRGDYRAAERLLSAAIAEDSNFAMAAFYLTLTRGVLGTPVPGDPWERVLRLAERAPDRERLLIKATWALNAGRFELESLADSLAERYPAEVDGPYLQGYGRLLQADFMPAIVYMKRVLAMDSLGLRGESPRCRACDAIGQLIYAYLAVDSLLAAERLAREYVRQHPNSARAWSALAGALTSQDRYDEVMASHRKAVSINPMNEYDRIIPVVVHLRRGNFEEADRLVRALIREGSATDVTEGQWVLTISLRYQARWNEALKLTRDATAALPATDRAGELGRGLKTNEALILLESGRAREAAVIWDSLARNAPSERAAGVVSARLRAFQFALLGGALAAAGDTIRLAATIDSVSRWATESRSRRNAHLVNHVRGLLHVARGDTAGAIALLERAIFSPTAGFTRTNRDLGALYLAQRRHADAVRVLGAALRAGSLESANLYVTRTELHELLARAFEGVGNADSASRHYRQVVAALERSDPGARPRYITATNRLAALTRKP